VPRYRASNQDRSDRDSIETERSRAYRKAAEACALAGSVAEGVTVSMDIEQLIYEAGTDGRHTQTIMTFTRRLSNVETIQQQDRAVRALNKLARTFVSQMEALKRY